MTGLLFALIPILVFLELFLFLLGSESGTQRDRGLPGSFLLSTILWGLVVLLSAEILTLFQSINRYWLAGTWILAAGLVAVLGARKKAFQRGRDRIRALNTDLSTFEWMLLMGMGVMAGSLLVIALVSPPNNIDSFLYHMSRVMHWAQNESLEHFPVYRDHQLNKPIWAETAILHLRVLWGNDRLANLVQWFSMLGSIIGVAGIAGLIGGHRRGQMLSAVFALTVPMGILQATSTQNDYVTAFWAVCLAYFVVLNLRRTLTGIEYFGLAGAFGLGILTKGVFFVYFPPLLIWFFLNLMRRKGLLKSFALGVAMLATVFIINLGFWARNIGTYGGPYGTSEWLQRNLGFDINFINRLFESEEETSLPGTSQMRVFTGNQRTEFAALDAGVYVANRQAHAENLTTMAFSKMQFGFLDNYLPQLARTIGRNFTSPFGSVTKGLVNFVDRFPSVFGTTYGDELSSSAWNHEDHAGNLHHLLLIATMIVLLPLAFRSDRSWPPMLYGLAIANTYLLLPIVIGHAESYWGVRYQLPFFVLFAPVFGYLLSRVDSNWLHTVMAGGLLIAALPWLLLNNTRPVIGMPPWPTKIESIFVVEQEQILMANNPSLLDDYAFTAQEIQSANCRSVGLIVDQSFLEYPLWWLLEAPQSNTEIRVIVSESDRYPSFPGDFQPCAVVCTNCGEETNMRGLSDRKRFDTLTLFR